MTPARRERLKRKIMEARARISSENAEFARPLYDIFYIAVKNVWRISTNGKYIYFDPDWFDKLGIRETDFILAHQLMHIMLGHTERPKYFRGDRFHLACDIIANANLIKYGFDYERLSLIGRIYTKTFYPEFDGTHITLKKAFHAVPFDPSAMKESKRRGFMIDSDILWDRKDAGEEDGEVILSPGDGDVSEFAEYDNEEVTFIIKHTPMILMDDKSINSGDAISIDQLPDDAKKIGDSETGEKNEEDLFSNVNETEGEKNQEEKSDFMLSQEIEYLRYVKNNDEMRRENSEISERLWKNIYRKGLDWKAILHSFVQEEMSDYSFSPPDRRYEETDFFLPDFNVPEEEIKSVLFMVDTSCSVDEDMLSVAYSEITCAVEQLGSSMEGYLGFFDTRVYPPVRFGNIKELEKIIPQGGGGTDFNCVFDYLKTLPYASMPSNIVIFTDGKADFPDESSALGIPVLWLMVKTDIVPPWGKAVWTD